MPMPSIKSPAMQRNLMLWTRSLSAESHSRNCKNSFSIKHLLPTWRSEINTAYASDLLLLGI